LIAVKGSGVNPSDIGAIAGRFKSILPRIPGRDFSGIVVGGNDQWKGKEVWGSGAGFGVTRDGAHAEFLALPSDWLSEKPATLSIEQAAAVGVPYLAAWESMVRAGELRESEHVLVTGANGAVGQAAVQIARWKKAFVIGADITDSSSDVDAFIDTKHQDLVEEVRRITDGRGADLVLDTVGDALFEPCLKSLAAKGRQVAIASQRNRRVEFNLMDFYHQQTRLLGVDTTKTSGPLIATTLDELRAGFASGHLRPPRIEIHPFDKAIEVYSGLAAKTLLGKQVLVFH
jgi:NADPH:quinone reductase